ncbi:hypothetical protein [Streptomyces sp. NPDC047525]|uniref:hypothetical protein n=1 Tax=Streptomyces sp. NPDC047525 TaxID=3155264 RepID=UPI0033EBF56D
MTDAQHFTPREPATGSAAPVTPPASVPPPAPAPAPLHATDSVLIPQDERDKLGLRLQQALNTFVESPRQAVEEADSLFDDAVRHLTETLTERRRTLRASWQGRQGTEAHTETHTEELRLALREYRESMERLLRI